MATSATTLAAMITVIVRRGAFSRGLEAILTDCGVAIQDPEGIAGGEAVARAFLTEGTPSVRVAKVTASLAEHEWRVREGLV